MKRIYIILFALPILGFTLLYLSIWWSIGVISALLIYLAYRFFSVKLDDIEARNEVLENELEDLHMRLETAVVKEERTSKEVAQVRQSKQQLLTVIGHEIRTPMNGVMGNTLLLADTSLSKEQQEYLATIRSCSESLLTTVNNLLVNDMLDYSKLQQGIKQLEYKDFNLRDCVEEILEMFAAKAEKSGVALLFDMEENVPSHIIGDHKRLQQVLINLVENAVKFTYKGEILVKVTYSLHDAAGNPPQLHFSIQDTGIGIEKEQVRQLFKGIPGKEIRKETENDTTGLGLVICKKLVELMGGGIIAVSEPGMGSNFTFGIPLTPSLKTPHTQQYNMAVLEGKRILIVDENNTSRSILAKQSKAWKMLPVLAGSTEEAAGMLSNIQGIDLVLSDKPVTGVSITQLVLNKPVRRHVLLDQLIDAFTPKDGAKPSGLPLSDLFAEKYPLQILIAEDNQVNQKIAVKILTKLGYEPALANNGKEAVEMAGDQHYDIILMDVQMPEMDGLEASRMLRTCLEIQPVIIALTANAMHGDRDECIQAGMDDYMSKPIELKELLRQLEKWAIVIRERRPV